MNIPCGASSALVALLLVLLTCTGACAATPGAAERDDANKWAQRHLLGSVKDLALSFRYGDRDSRDVMADWKREITQQRLDSGTVTVVTWTDPARTMRICIKARQFTASSSVDWVVTLANISSSDSLIYSDIRPLDVLVPGASSDQFDLHHALGEFNSADSFKPVSDHLVLNQPRVFTPRGGRSSDGVMPFFNLQHGGGGVAMAVGWSGQWASGFQREPTGVRVQAGMQKTHLLLHPGEQIRTPRILLTFWRGDDALRGNHLMRQTLIDHYTPRRSGQVVYAPICGSVGEVDPGGNYEGPHIRVMKPLAERGIEVFWSDMDPQQWYPRGFPEGTGTWEPDLVKYPHGLKPIGDAAREAGLGYLLWFEPERVAPATQIASEHPEWVTGGSAGGLFRLDDPIARRWLYNKIDAQITLAQLEWVRWDFNIEPLGFWASNDKPDRVGMTEIRHIEGLYAFWDELERRHPGLLIDICASGGRRLDIETISRGIPLWHSDMQCDGAHPEADQLQNAGLYRWLPMHACGVFGLEPSYAFRSAATTGNVFCLAAHAPENAAGVRRSVDLQTRLRPYTLGNFYETLPHEAATDRWFAYQFHRADMDAGYLIAFRRAGCADAAVTLAVKGVASKTLYRVTNLDTGAVHEMTGAQMAALRVEVAEKPGSCIILYERAR